jgi:hypothetical protein
LVPVFRLVGLARSARPDFLGEDICDGFFTGAEQRLNRYPSDCVGRRKTGQDVGFCMTDSDGLTVSAKVRNGLVAM